MIQSLREVGAGIGSVVQKCRPVFLWFFTCFLHVSQLHQIHNEHKRGIGDLFNENKAFPRYFRLQWLDLCHVAFPCCRRNWVAAIVICTIYSGDGQRKWGWGHVRFINTSLPYPWVLGTSSEYHSTVFLIRSVGVWIKAETFDAENLLQPNLSISCTSITG